MKLLKILLVVIVAGTIMACQSAQDRAAKSQEEVNRERLELVDKYQECIKKAEKDKEKEAECEQYLKAAEALK
jgi:Ni/Co efflux regulator RcnB